MQVGHKLLTNFILVLCFIFPASGATTVAAAALDASLVEEGWRYHGTLKVKLQYLEQEHAVDFSQEHMSMAHLIRADADSGQYSSMLRFTPVFSDGKGLSIGSTVCLKAIECLQTPLPSYEVAFASGIYNRLTQDAIMKCRTSVDIELASTESADHIVKRDIMTLRSATHSIGSGKEKEYHPNTYPVRFVVANYFDRGLLEQQLRFRYASIDKSILRLGNLNLVVRPHLEVLRRIDVRKQEIAATMREMASELQRNDTATVLAHYSKQLTETEVPPINTHESTNSYTCAEQANLSYLYDHRVRISLQKALNVDDHKFVGLVVHAHCSHTPCHTCATSFTRESELGGVLSSLAKGKKVSFLCSCAEHYKRPAKMLGYEKTLFRESLLTDHANDINVIDFSMEVQPLPYPIVKLTYDAITAGWSVYQTFLKGLIRPEE